MLLAIGIDAPYDAQGHGRRGWLIHELVTDDGHGNPGTLYRGFFDAEGQTNAYILHHSIADVYEVCNGIPVTASYYRERKREPYPITYGRDAAGIERENLA